MRSVARWGTTLLTAAGTLLFALGCGGDGDENRGAVSVITTEELVALLEQDPPPFLLDVRTPGEYAQGHIPAAVLIPEYALEKRISELARHGDRTIVVYCEVGARSAAATRTLLDKGFPHAVNYHGSMRAWRQAGLEVER